MSMLILISDVPLDFTQTLDQIHILSCCKYMVPQYGHLFTSGPGGWSNSLQFRELLVILAV